MRKFAMQIFFALGVYMVMTCLSVWLLPSYFPSLGRLDIVNVAIQLLAAISTLSAVLWALFGASFVRKIRRSCLRLYLEKDDEHCCFVSDASEIPGETRTRLGIFAKVCNESSVDAEACQVVTGEVFTSSDGIKFSKFQKICTASFSWVYESKCETTIRKGVAKYFKAVELLEKTTFEQKNPDGTVVKPGGRAVSLYICIPNFVNGQDFFDIGPDYKGVMIPISLVSKTEDVMVCYLKVVWLGSILKDYMIADKLKVMVISEDDAKRDII